MDASRLSLLQSKSLDKEYSPQREEGCHWGLRELSFVFLLMLLLFLAQKKEAGASLFVVLVLFFVFSLGE